MSAPARLAAALADRYRIERELGQGGMATVYLAHDIKHERRVALKVLKPELAAVLGAERFIVEIRTTAALQHPHILPLFDSGTADGFLYYVMPFIDGETLRTKLDRETQLGVEEAVRIASDVAGALHYAHTHGVIHRDIKPENILLHDGRPVVADFGIALALSAAAGGRMTETGLSLGTPHYMSPEQATAEKEITARSDVYSLASVLYEMLTGNPPHTGASAQQIIMKIITEQPQPVTTLRKSVPPNVAAAVAKGIEKLPADRFESAKAFGDALHNTAFRVEGHASSAGGPIAGAGAYSRRAFAGISILAIIASAAAIWSWLPSPAPPATSARYQLSLFATQADDRQWRHLGFSRDGMSITFVQSRGNSRMIWLKPPGRAVAEPIAGTEGASAHTFSPDGEWIAFVAEGRVRKVRRDGSEATTLAEGVPTGVASIAWLDNGTVLFSGPRFGLNAVGADGASARVVIARDSLSNNVFDIAAVSGGESALIITCSSNCTESELWGVDVRSGARRKLADRAMSVWYLDDGIVVYGETQSDRILAAAYDAKKLEFRAPPTPVFEGVRRSGGEGIAMAVSHNGTLLYAPGEDSAGVEAVWITRQGKVTAVDSGWTFSAGGGAAISPDGKQLAIAIQTGSSSDIWLKQLTNGGGLTRFTFSGNAVRPEWADNGASLVYTDAVGGPGPYFVRKRRIDGTDSSRTLLRSSRGLGAIALLRDTTQLILRFGPPPTRDIYLARRSGAGDADSLIPLLASDDAEEMAPSLSPDEHWLAYVSSEMGRANVFVVPFPNVKAGKRQVSLAGGRSPRWARSGRELFFRDLDNRVMSVAFTGGTSPTFGEQKLLFSLDGFRPGGYARDPTQVQFDVSTDDQRFLFLRKSGEDPYAANTPILIQQWGSEVKERMRKDTR